MERNKGLTRRAFLISSAGCVPFLTGCSTFMLRKDCSADLKNDSISLVLFRKSDNFFAFLDVYGFCVKERFGRYYLLAFEGTIQADRLLVFTFPPQHFSETVLDKSKLEKINTTEAAWNAEIDELLSNIDLMSSKSSTLVFQVPDNRDALPYRGKRMPLELDHLLSWEHFDYVTEDVKNPYNKDDIFPPPIPSRRNFLLGYETWKGKGKSQVSAIDMPAGFYLQPYTRSKSKPYRWHLTIPKDEGDGYSKNWSAMVVPEGLNRNKKINFELIDIWGIAGDGKTDYVNVNKSYKYDGQPIPTYPKNPGLKYTDKPITYPNRINLALSLSPRFERGDMPITFNYVSPDGLKGPLKDCYAPDHYLSANRYGISADGGTTDLTGYWRNLSDCKYTGLFHQSVKGRDSQVKVIMAGALYPYGFNVELVEETKRSYLRDCKRHLVAPLVKETYIRAVKPNHFTATTLEEGFTQIKLLTERTPTLDTDEFKNRHPGKGGLSELHAFLPRVNGKEFQFEFEGIDHSGKSISWNSAVYYVSDELTNQDWQGGYPEEANGPFVSNQLKYPKNTATEDTYYIDCTSTGSNAIKLIDRMWQKFHFRFANFGGEIISLARPKSTGDTALEIGWCEWVRGRNPTKRISSKYPLEFKMVPRIRTLRFIPQGLRTFAGYVPPMLGSFRDMRVMLDKAGKVTTPRVLYHLDPEESLPSERFEIGLLNPQQPSNKAGTFISALSLLESTKLADRSRPKSSINEILSAYYPDADSTDTNIQQLFSGGLTNFVEFGRAKSSESAGGLGTPDMAVALITREFGAQGDNRQAIDHWQNAVKQLKNTAKRQKGLLNKSIEFVSGDRFIYSGGHISTGLIQLGIDDIFGENAEILPGIKYSDVINFIFQVGDNDSAKFAPGIANFNLANSSDTPTSDNGLKWNTKLNGADWLLNLLGGNPGTLSFDELVKSLLNAERYPKAGEPLNFTLDSTLNWETFDFDKAEFASSVRFLPTPYESNFTNKDGKTRFSVEAMASIDIFSPDPKVSAKSEFEYFSLTFFDAISVAFERVIFELDLSGKKKFTPEIAGISFSGPLSFVNGLQELLTSLGDDYGLDIRLTPQRVSVSQRLSFPPGKESKVIHLGPATISNLFFTWGVSIPILGRDTVSTSVSLASRETPMTIAVGIYGGRCYTMVTADMGGIKLIELSTDYGGVFQAEWGGIAKGSCSLTAGFFFSLAREVQCSSAIHFYAFVQFSGRLSIVSLFSVSASAMLALGFKSGCEGDVIYGVAKCRASIKIVLKKFSYKYQVYREEKQKEGRKEDNSIALFSTSDVDGDKFQTEDQLIGEEHFLPFKEFGSEEEWRNYFNALA